ncbi:hypothetical protein BG004_004064 [Podila humilis]|nr:hypothetical protein BG004_004064 [Podila humilis]
MSNINNLYEDDQHAFEAYAMRNHPRRVVREVPQLLTLDDYNLISLGYKPVMSRGLPWISVAGIAVTGCNVFSGVLPLFGLSITNGGPAWATWSFLVIGVMSCIVSLCLAELASAYPCTAGVHHWVYQLGSSKRRAYLSWMVGWFSIVSSSEESRRPEKSMPWLVTGSSVVSLLIGMPLVITLSFGTIKPIKGLLDESIPGVKIIVETLGDRAAVTYLSMVLVAISFAGFVRLVAATRVVYAFARDGGVPHSVYWNHLHPRRKNPHRVSWLVAAASMCCIFPFFWGNSEAFRWISSLACITANITFIIPLWMRLTHEGRLHYIPGTFSLGSFSRILHVASIIWLVGHSFLLMLPSSLPLTKNNFNYSSVALVALTIVFAISWAKARSDFTGGAKDVSRASHRLPARPMTELPTSRKPQPAYRSNMAAIEPRTLNIPMVQQPPKSRQLANQSVIRSLNLLANSNNRHDPGNDNSRTSNWNAVSVSKKQQQHRQQKKKQRPQPVDTTRMPQGHQASNVTMASHSSAQSHPSSILGLPFSDSPEMMHKELTAQTPDPTPPSLPSSHVPPLAESTPSSIPKDGLLLTQPFNTTAAAAVPEISIAPPTTTSTTSNGSPCETPKHEKDAQFAKGQAKPSKIVPAAAAVPVILVHGTVTRDGGGDGSATASTSSLTRPLNAIDSIFKRGFIGLGNMVSSSVPSKHIATSTSSGDNNIYGVTLRSSKDRVPTPYPYNTDNRVASSDMGHSSSFDDSASYIPESPSTAQFGGYFQGASLSPPPRPTQKASSCAESPARKGEQATLDEIVQATSIYQYPTLDGHPLAHSPFLVLSPTEENDSHHHTGRGSVGQLSAPFMLPLSRTPTIQQSDHDGQCEPSIGLPADNDDDENDENNCIHEHGQDSNQVTQPEVALLEQIKQEHILESFDFTEIEIGEEDTSYEEEYNHHYPVISVSPAHLKALMPMTTSSVGIFQLPNRDISIVKEATNRQQQQQQQQQQPRLESGVKKTDALLVEDSGQHVRQDPVERFTYHEIDSEQQHLERTRSVACWAQEQAKIQRRRAKKQARAQALKALRMDTNSSSPGAMTSSGSQQQQYHQRKKGTVGTASTITSSSSSFSDTLSSLSFPRSMSSSSSGGRRLLQRHSSRVQPGLYGSTTAAAAAAGVDVAIAKKTKVLKAVGAGGARYQIHPAQQPLTFASVKEGASMQFIDDNEEEEDMEDNNDGDDNILYNYELHRETGDGVRQSLDIESIGAGVGRP